MPRKPVVCTFFIEETVEKQVLFFLDGSLNFLVGLVFEEKHDGVYAKPSHAQKKV